MTCFLKAVKHGNYDIAKIINMKGVTINDVDVIGRNAVYYCIMNEQLEFLEYLLVEKTDFQHIDKVKVTNIKEQGNFYGLCIRC